MTRLPYTQEISRQNKALFVFLLDQSFSMEEPLAGGQSRKCDELCAAINGWLQNMSIRASSDQGVKDWIDIGVFGYRTDAMAQPVIESALVGPLAGQNIVSIANIANYPARIDNSFQYFPDDATGQMIQVPAQMPIWVDPIAEGGTPMCHAFYLVHQLVQEWIGYHQYSFPPVVVHFTDGESQDGDPRPYADALQQLATYDGNVLLFNCHLSLSQSESFLFPNTEAGLPDMFAQVLFQMSSVLPDIFVQYGMSEGLQFGQYARGMAFNADLACLLQFLNMGTQAAPGMI